MAVDVEHHLAGALRMFVATALVDGKDLVVGKLGWALAGDLAHRVEHAGLEIDQRTDDVEGEDLEIAERHESFFSFGGTRLLKRIHTAAFGTMMVSSG